MHLHIKYNIHTLKKKEIEEREKEKGTRCSMLINTLSTAMEDLCPSIGEVRFL